MKFLHPGHGEPIKKAVHQVAWATFGTMFVYNAAAFLVRRDWRLGFNAVLYGSLTVFETHQVRRHATNHAQRPR